MYTYFMIFQKKYSRLLILKYRTKNTERLTKFIFIDEINNTNV